MSACMFITTYYDTFLQSFYDQRPHLTEALYETQLTELCATFFGDSDFYSKGIKLQGWSARDIIFNCAPLQHSWARENGFSGNAVEIAIEQIRQEKPQVVYLQDMSIGTRQFIKEIQPYTELIVGQIASPVPASADIAGFDIIFSSFPHFVERFRQSEVTSYYQPLAFDDRVLDKINGVDRNYPVTFIGGISPLHGSSIETLTELAQNVPIEFWGYGAESLPENSPIKKKHNGNAWGLDMFTLLHQSRITVNRHIDVAENHANNMRLFEATGCGALLLTDHKDNLNELFQIGKEIVAYRSPEECIAQIKYYMANPDEAQKIARAGQERTLRDHAYSKRMAQTAEILGRHLRYKKEKNVYPVPQQISDGHALIQPSQISKEMTMGWQDASIPPQQRGLVQAELAAMYANKVPPVFQALASSLHQFVFSDCSILEIGCASGYYYEILEYLLNQRIAYTGVDYSPALIAMAKDYYPGVDFHVADGANLPFSDDQFFIAISSCVLLHVPNYLDHIAETVRVAQRYVVAHRTPVSRQRATQYLKKNAYGVETVELLFNEEDILAQFLSHDLKLIETNEFYADPNNDRFEITYLFKKADTQEKQSAPLEQRVSQIKPSPAKTNRTPVMLNLGCGTRYHKEWINIDFKSTGPEVTSHNLCLGIPSPDTTFDVVYHSHLLEHFPKQYVPEFLAECHRVLKPGGIIRVVQPDLEQMVRLYLDALEKSLQGDRDAQNRYEWLMLELFDQMVRNRSGGEMLEYWKQNPMPAEEFVIERCGSQVLGALQHIRKHPQNFGPSEDPYLKAIQNADQAQVQKMAQFRMCGETHQWMYDRYSLKKLLVEAGFVDPKLCRADESAIPGFNSYHLDMEPNGSIRKPDSFFMEARK